MISKPFVIQTLRQMHAQTTWCWLNCREYQCGHRVAVTLAQFVIRWGPEESSDRLRHAAVCGKCGRRGASTMMPSWMGEIRGFAQFPGL